MEVRDGGERWMEGDGGERWREREGKEREKLGSEEI